MCLKRGEKQKPKDAVWEDGLVRDIAIFAVFFLLLILAFFLGDYFNLADTLNIHLRFDWTAIFCMFLSAFASIVLGTVAIIQNKRAEEMNKRLVKINQDQLETSIVKDGYPLIRFCDLQRIEENGDILVLRFFDTRNNPLKEACTWNINAVPLKGKFENEKTRREIKIRDEKVKELLQFTFNNDDSQTGFYMIKVSTAKLFDGYRYCRIELEMELISTTGVVTRCKSYALLDSESNHKGMPGREYPYVYHQFFEIKEIMSERKYNSRSQKAKI